MSLSLDLKGLQKRVVSSPDLPRDLMTENVFLGDIWDEVLQAKHHRRIVGDLTRQSSIMSQKYEWRRVILNPIHSRSTD